MDSKGVNPFLMDDYPAADDTSLPSNVNPFLQDFTDASATDDAGGNENPFLNFTADPTYETTGIDATNPFASFVAEAPVVEPVELSVTEPPADTMAEQTLIETATTPVQFPEETKGSDHLFGEEPSEIFEKPAIIAKLPARPPPPPPPPRNTKDLILSVTGEMDATSDHLLNRLQATRTPSPTLMHSPSPTPEHSYADLLDVDTNVPDIASDETHQTTTADMLDIFSPASALDTTADMNFTSMPFELTTNTVTTTSGIDYLSSAKVQDNPFNSEPSAEDMTQDIAQNAAKRPSIVNTSPVSEPVMPDIASIDSGTPAFESTDDQPYAEVMQQPFEDTPSNYPEQAAQPFTSSELFGDGFGEPAATVLLSTSPTPGAEFPVTEIQPPFSSANDLGMLTMTTKPVESTGDAFDAFASKFDQAAEISQRPVITDPFMDPFGGSMGGQVAMDTSSDVWGDQTSGTTDGVIGFGEADTFDEFLSMTAPPPSAIGLKRGDSGESDEGPDFSVFIKPKEADQMTDLDGGIVPVLAPPPKSPMSLAYADTSPRFNPFDKTGFAQDAVLPGEGMPQMERSDSQETPPTPLFDEDTSQPLEEFPRIIYTGEGWEMQLRQPNKKRITSQRFWKKIFVRLVLQADNPVLQIFNSKGDKDPFQELPLLPSYSVSEICAQQFDQYGKIFTVKLQYIFYKERPGVRPGQVTKAERLTNKLSQFAAYAIQGDYQGVKEFGSDLKKLGLPVEHAPQISELLKLGSTNYEDMKQFSHVIEEALFKLSAHRDRALHYKMEEVQISVVDEIYVEQSAEGHVEKQIARVRLFFLGFLSGMPDVELGINDMWRQGKEVVGRHDIIPVVTEEWIRLEKIEFHACVQQDEYEKTRIIKFKPPDACYIELMRFRVRPPKNRELPLQLKAVICVTGNKVELKADILVPGFASRKLGQVPCEDVMVRFPIPECWIYLFRVEKHFRYGSVKSAHRRTGKVKGIERFLGTVDTLTPQLMEATSGQAKYEHQHHAIVWRMPRLPKEGQGAYTTHQLTCTMHLTSFDQIPDDLEKITEFCYVEFTMPATQVSHTTARSVSFQNSDSDEPPEKYVRNLSRHEYRVGIDHVQGEGPGAYVAATMTKKVPQSIPEHQEPAQPAAVPSDSDSADSD